MSSKGLIYLYDSDNNAPISVKKYHDRVKRKNIINDWRRKYAKAFYRCYLIISPEITDDYDYDAIESKLDEQISNCNPTAFKRPKAEYKGIYNTESKYSYGIIDT